MKPTTSPWSPPRLASHLGPPVLLGMFVLLGVTSLARKNATFDEVAHIPAGYSYLRTGEVDLNKEHPPLVKLIAALPLLPLRPGDPREFDGFARREQWDFGRAFLFENRVPADRIVFWARIPLLLLSAALGWSIYRWSRQIHGEAGGLLSLTLFAFSPTLIAHGRLVTTDAPIALFSLLGIYFLWRNLAAPPGKSWLPYGAALALAFLSKYSAVLLIPSAAAVTFAWLFLERPERSVAREVLWRLSLATVIPVALVLVLGFGPTQPLAYLEGFLEAFRKLNRDYPFYLAGQFSEKGFLTYYLVAFVLKTPLPILGFLAIAVLGLRRFPRLALISLLIPALLFFLAPTIQRYNIGLRYILPVYPFLFVFAGGAARLLTLRRACAWGGAALAGYLILGTLLAYPHYIPYFNEIAGGSKGGIRWLDDSNVDWGQELKALGRVAREEGMDGMGVLYHGMVPPRYYLPTSYTPSVQEAMSPRRGQVYAVSAQRALREGWLERGDPFRIIGHSIYLYRFP